MEFLGTMLFQTFGGAPGATGLENGLLLMVIIWMTAEHSGGHVNPAVTFSLMITGNCDVMTGLCYIPAQILGAIIGAIMTVQFTNDNDPNVQVDYGHCHSLSEPNDKDGAFGWEFWMTFILCWVVHQVAVSDPQPTTAPFAIGLVIAVTAGIDGQFTGGFGNPARFLGPLI